MRLLQLDIHDVRGIRSLTLRPEGTNFVIWGPNGSGKSAVVDALDFLLTGRISRLTGRGTGGITLRRHGPHVDSRPEDASVRALLAVPGIAQPVELRRCIAQPDILESDPSAKGALAPILELAERGQHVLTRREILRFVATEAGTRAQDIQHLLNLTPAETIRKALVTVRHRSEMAEGAARTAVGASRGRVAAVASLRAFDPVAVLAFVNAQRALLDASAINELRAASVREGLVRPVGPTTTDAVDAHSTRTATATLRLALDEGSMQRLTDRDRRLRELLAAVRADHDLHRWSRRRDLIRMGDELIDETGACPLCETPWPVGGLRAQLRTSLAEADAILSRIREVTSLAETIAAEAAACSAAARTLAQTAAIPGADRKTLDQWAATADRLGAALATPTSAYPVEGLDVEQAARLGAPEEAAGVLDGVDRALKGLASAESPQLTAWDALIRIQEALLPLEAAEGALERQTVAARRARALSAAYDRARDEILGSLYAEVRDRFVALYRQLHGSDEDSFTAELTPEGAGLQFLVDFHGYGVHPPQALHSEGHQDSMGICLYLALAERLTGGVIQLTILDDVMMSVDAEHRRALCRLLGAAFPDRQLMITTHDRTWAGQLRTEGVVTARQCVQFYGWQLATGPRVLSEGDLWTRIDEDLTREEVASAAHRLRRGSEEYFGDVCESLWARVRYRMSGRVELGDLLPAAIIQYKALLKKAKAAANAWDQKDIVEQLALVESTAGQTIQRSRAEEWAVNENVHYNAWASFSKADLVPVIEAFHDLFDVFRCSSCQRTLRVVSSGPGPAAVQCACGAVSWNLVGP